MTSIISRWSRPARLAVLSALLAIAAVAVTACGSSSGSSSTAGSSASSKGDLTTADKLAAQWAQRPTQIPVSQPIGKPIPTGKRIDFINCGVTACTSLYKNLNDAAKTLGWTVKQINTHGHPGERSGRVEAGRHTTSPTRSSPAGFRARSSRSSSSSCSR